MQNNKALRRNVLAATAIATAGNAVSQVEENRWGRGVRFYVTVASPTAGGGTDSFYLCAQIPGTATVIPLTGFAAANLLAVAGTYCFDFYPGAWLPASGLATSGLLKGAAGVHLPLMWAVKAVMGTGNAATLTVDAEILP